MENEKIIRKVKRLLALARENKSDAVIYGNAQIFNNVNIFGNAKIHSNAVIPSNRSVCWFSCVGSERGTLTAYTAKDDTLRITRGCFEGTLSEFESAVENRHGNSKFAQEYKALITYLKIRFGIEEVKE
ncbi:TPA: hypothetical protein ACP2FU_001144 [Listeria monocytogenes]|uniref:hypothetical protein n=1 Tax=Listeria monocytogenes TaxID=1639 RepID=UPI000E6D42F9|nr:hypothetical protein [Listeria monocytogenes]EAG1886157.1 hypothetical protein [Listeria monocytogenes]EAG8694443.1 hypothetical protein [Listeria monocytogenes]EAW0607608.1 hypothetical protein [Listeria monocytogenes]EEA8531620.1 hypothetical protein [Listeria monocytogenes]EHV5872684.1 hypothetical protein [Listeria monocytogenes]